MLITIVSCSVLGCKEVSPSDDELLAFSQLANVSFSCYTFPGVLADYTSQHDGNLPKNMEALVDWYNNKDSEVKWSSRSLSELYDINWDFPVSGLTKESLVNPPLIIKCTSDYLLEYQTTINKSFVEYFLRYQERDETIQQM